MRASLGMGTVSRMAAVCLIVGQSCQLVLANESAESTLGSAAGANSTSPPHPGVPLSERLDETGGLIHPKYPHDREAVIQPPKGMDPEIKVPPPVTPEAPAAK